MPISLQNVLSQCHYLLLSLLMLLLLFVHVLSLFGIAASVVMTLILISLSMLYRLMKRSLGTFMILSRSLSMFFIFVQCCHYYSGLQLGHGSQVKLK